MYFSTILDICRKFILITVCFILISAFIGLFNNGINLSLHQYLQNIISIVKSLSHPADLTITNRENQTFSMFPTFWDYYFYSVIIFIGSIVVSFFFGMLMSFMVYILPKKISEFIFKITSLLESLPDILILMFIQYIAILSFKRTGVLWFSVAEYDEKIYSLPILTLSILPSILIFRITHLLINDELSKSYIDLVKSKGFSHTYIFFKHIFPNISFSLLNHSKSIILFSLSNLIIFERLFNIYGITHFILSFPQAIVICFSLIMFYIPIFIIIIFFSVLLELKTGQKVVI